MRVAQPRRSDGMPRFEAAGRKVENGFHLVPRQPVVQLNEFVDSDAIFQIFERRRNWHPQPAGHCGQSSAAMASPHVPHSASFFSHTSSV